MHGNMEQLGTDRADIQAIGRPAVSANVFAAVDAIKQIERDDFEVEAIEYPALDYFQTDWLEQLAGDGMDRDDPDLGLSPDSKLPEAIYKASDLLKALYESSLIDQNRAGTKLPLDFLRLRFKTTATGPTIMNIDAALADEFNTFYTKQQTTLRGERAVVGRIKYIHFNTLPVDPSQEVPTTYLRLARVKSGLLVAAKTAVRDAVLPHLSNTKVDVGPIGPIAAT